MNTKRIAAILIVLLLGLAAQGRAEKVRAITTLLGAESMPIEGEGVVQGLKGTGDKKDAARKLIQAHLESNDYVLDINDLATSNLALVRVDAEIPAMVRPGERIDLRISSIIDAESLKGGILKAVNLRFQKNGPVIIRASGRITINSDNPTTGYITGGGLVVSNEFTDGDVVDEENTFRLLLKRKSHQDAASIAHTINSNDSTNPNLKTEYGFGERKEIVPVARAVDAGMVEVQIPRSKLKEKVKYIAAVLNLDAPVAQHATILLDRQSGAAVISGEVRITPGFISYKGRTVTLTAAGQNADNVESYDLPQDTPRALAGTSGPGLQSGNASLRELVNTLSAMQMSTDDVIVIMHKLKEAGMVHAEVIVK